MSAELIAKLEAATEGSRELDARIEVAISNGWPPDCVFEFTEGGCIHVRRGDSKAIDEARGWYTSRIEDALRLIPKKWSWRTGNLPSGKGFADLGTQKSLQCVVGATPALALCIAALKARHRGAL